MKQHADAPTGDLLEDQHGENQYINYRSQCRFHSDIERLKILGVLLDATPPVQHTQIEDTHIIVGLDFLVSDNSVNLCISNWPSP
jgi:hypothetical protein